jgi:hypothetical protein
MKNVAIRNYRQENTYAYSIILRQLPRFGYYVLNSRKWKEGCKFGLYERICDMINGVNRENILCRVKVNNRPIRSMQHRELVMNIFDCKSDEMHTDFLCVLYYTVLALHVSGAICTHHQEHKLQSTAVSTRDCYGVLEVG